jgi:hypothetical protein
MVASSDITFIQSSVKFESGGNAHRQRSVLLNLSLLKKIHQDCSHG